MRKSLHFRQGFTLVELMVSIAIMGTLTGIMLARYPDSAMRLNLANISNHIMLTTREAQLRGSSVDVSGGAAGYGIYSATSNPKQIIFFYDSMTGASKNGIYIGDGLYGTTTINETKTLITLPTNYKISALCVGTGFPFSCNASNTPAITSLTITFERPNPQPLIYINKATSTAYSGACLEVSSPKAPQLGHIRSVRVFSSGLVTGAQTGCR